MAIGECVGVMLMCFHVVSVRWWCCCLLVHKNKICSLWLREIKINSFINAGCSHQASGTRMKYYTPFAISCMRIHLGRYR